MRHVVHVGADHRDEVGRHIEDPYEPAFTIELEQRRPVFIGHEEVARPRIDDQAFGVEAVTEHACVAVEVERVQAVQFGTGTLQQAIRDR